MTENHLTRPDPDPDTVLSDVVCPFCALLCDDVSLPLRSGRPNAQALACPKARHGFAQALAQDTAQPLLDGEPVPWPAALAQARQLLADARQPLFDGLLGDLLDSRTAWRLAAHYGGVVDHRDGDAVARNLAVYQDSGWLVTSLGEARNRADLLILIGDDFGQAMPRFAEKLLTGGERLHRDTVCEVLSLEADPLRVLDHTRVLLGRRPLPDPDPQAQDLHRRLGESQYPVFAVGPLSDAPGTVPAELVLRAASELVRDINRTRRAALLPLATGLGEVTAQLSGSWHNGFGLRTGFARGYPEHDRHRHAAQRLLGEGAADLHVWLSSLSDQPPPRCAQPQIVIGHPAIDFAGQPPAVFLPVAVPGVQRAGFLHRADGLRMLPLAALVDSDLPDSAALCRELLPADAAEIEAC